MNKITHTQSQIISKSLCARNQECSQQNSQHRLRSPNPEGGEPLVQLCSGWRCSTIEWRLLMSIAFNIILSLEEFEDTKGVIRIRKSKKDRKNNGRTKKEKHWSTEHTHKTKDCVTRTPVKPGVELRCSGRVGYLQSPSFTIIPPSCF